MPQPQFIQSTDGRRQRILESVDLESDTPLAWAVEEMVRQAERELPTLPKWFPLGARNAYGISALRVALEQSGQWTRWEHRHLEGVRHLETGRIIAVHNSCERTGLDLAGKLPRFAAIRKRTATKSLRDDLQGELELFEEEGEFASDTTAGEISATHDDLTLHLCAFIDFENAETGERVLKVRAELIIGATCSDLGFTSAKFRVPIDLSGLEGASAPKSKPASPAAGGAVEADIPIRKRR